MKKLLCLILFLPVIQSNAMDHRKCAKKMHHIMTRRKVSDIKGLPTEKGIVSEDTFFQTLSRNHVTSTLGESKKEQCKQLQEITLTPSFRSSLSRKKLYTFLPLMCMALCAQNVEGRLARVPFAYRSVMEKKGLYGWGCTDVITGYPEPDLEEMKATGQSLLAEYMIGIDVAEHFVVAFDGREATAIVYWAREMGIFNVCWRTTAADVEQFFSS